MSKTNTERAHKVLKLNSVIDSWKKYNHVRLLVNGIQLEEEIATALDKAERRGRKARPCCKPQPEPPQFDAENVKQLIGNLMGSVYYKATINDWFSESQKRAAEIVENDKHALLTALGLEE